MDSAGKSPIQEAYATWFWHEITKRAFMRYLAECKARYAPRYNREQIHNMFKSGKLAIYDCTIEQKPENQDWQYGLAKEPE